MPTYPHICNECNHEWDEFYSITQDPPDTCPKCGIKGNVERLIAGGSGRGIVEVTGHELKEKLQNDSADILKEAGRSEKFLANIVGEDKYQSNQIFRDKARRGDY
jgi:putative FmdB family regulatory protein